MKRYVSIFFVALTIFIAGACSEKNYSIDFNVGVSIYGDNQDYEKAINEAVNRILKDEKEIVSWNIKKKSYNSFKVSVNFSKGIKPNSTWISAIQKRILDQI